MSFENSFRVNQRECFLKAWKKTSATENTEFTEIFKGFSQSSLCALPKGIGTMCGKERVKKQLLSGL